MLVTKRELRQLSSPACSPQYTVTVPAGTRCEIVNGYPVVADTSKVMGSSAHDLRHYYVYVNHDDVEEVTP